MTQYRNGEQTGLFGEWLANCLASHPEFSQYTVYYDHGDRQANRNVVAIKGFYGAELSTKNQLTQADVMVVKPNHEIAMVIEVEERASSPKKVIGDIVANIMCNRFSTSSGGIHQYFDVTFETTLVIAGIISTKGSKVTQLDNVIMHRLRQFKTPLGGISLNNVTLVFRENIETTVDSLKKLIKKSQFS